MFCILLWLNNTWEIIKLKANDPFEGKFVVSEEAPRHTAPKPVKEKKAKKAKNKAVKKKGSKPRKAVLICGLIAAVAVSLIGPAPAREVTDLYDLVASDQEI